MVKSVFDAWNSRLEAANKKFESLQTKIYKKKFLQAETELFIY
jgi:hypothetical protein